MYLCVYRVPIHPSSLIHSLDTLIFEENYVSVNYITPQAKHSTSTPFTAHTMDRTHVGKIQMENGRIKGKCTYFFIVSVGYPYHGCTMAELVYALWSLPFAGAISCE